MKKYWWLLAIGLTACGGQPEIAADVALTPQHKAAFQQQAQLLQAEQVQVAATPASGAGAAGPGILTLEVINPHLLPGQHPDTLKQRMHKLAHLLVAGLASPAGYQAVSAQATFRPSLLSPSTRASSQTFIYPIASLK